MASLPYNRIVSSPPFTFVVGPASKEYTIHSQIVAHQSKPLNALVNGQAKEASERRVIWNETDEATFVRFSQFIYTGSYDEAAVVKRPAEDYAAQPNNSESKEAVTAAPKNKTKRNNVSVEPMYDNKRDRLWHIFTSLHMPEPYKSTAYINTSDDDCTELFLCHARLYVFADYHLMDNLQTLCLRNLRRALTRFVLHRSGCGDIAQLIEFCYENTLDRVGHSHPLRSLVCYYAACKMEDLCENLAFQELTKSVPDFSRDLLLVIRHRLD